MSALVWGAIEVKNITITLRELVNLASDIAMAAARNKLGFDIGYRVAPELYVFFKKFHNIKNSLPFSLSAHPLNASMISLIIRDGSEEYSGNEIFGLDIDDPYESLDSRMSRIQAFLEEALNITNVKNIILHIDSGWDSDTIAQISAKDFKKELLPLYRNRLFPPSVIFTISKDTAK
jgi:hypothetical protein